MIFDDTIQEKPYTDENEVMCWHYDHSKGRAVQGFNLLNCLYHVDGISIPVAFELIKKPIEYCDLKTHKRKRASLVTKSELMRAMRQVCVQNKLLFRDTWFAAKENMCFIKETLNKDYICALKSNRL
ncbi:MAG TPA: IS701 family transposase, partial [Chloroflexi bacterium]|nr:IS701 family transposase [Chloroflexota bacterium]